METFLGRNPALAADPDAVVELVYTEFLLRVDAGEAPSPEEYLGRFPQHAPALRHQFALHAAFLNRAATTAPTRVSAASWIFANGAMLICILRQATGLSRYTL